LLITDLLVVQQPIEHRQVRHRDGHLRHWRRRLPAPHHRRDHAGRQRRFAVEQGAQRLIDQRLTLRRRQLQDLQIFLVGLGQTPLTQSVVGHAKTAGREQLVAVAVVGKGAGLAHQRVNDVPVIDAVLAAATQTRQRLHPLLAVPHLQVFGIDPHLDPLADQPAVHRVDVVMHVNQTAAVHRDRQPLATVQPPWRQRPQHRQLLSQPPLPARVALPRQLLQERSVLLTAGEISAATQQQGLVHRVLEVPVRRLGIAVLIAFARLRLLHRQAVMRHQALVALGELLALRQVVDRAAEAVGAMPCGHAAQLPQRILQTVAQAGETLGKADRHRLPVRVGQHEVVHQVLEALAGDRHVQAAHVCEVRGAQPAGMVHLAEEHLLGRPACGPPCLDTSLQGPQLAVVEAPRILLLQPGEQGLGL
jgi:hypothetical protein